jgi:hypothetical protein
MNTNTLAITLALPDAELLARLPVLAAGERTATADLVAHLAALRHRPSLYAALGYGTLFAYCRAVLRLSEDAASNRIHAAKACLRFPVIFELLASGELSLSAVRMLRRHLTAENHESVLARARNARRVDIEKLVAELAPRPDVATSVRKLPMPVMTGAAGTAARRVDQAELPVMDAARPVPVVGRDSISEEIVERGGGSTATTDTEGQREADAVRPAVTLRPAATSRPVVQPLSPERYRVQFTMGQESHDVLRRLQTLLRREIPDGDAGAIFERALRVLHEKVGAAQFGKAPKRQTTGRAARSVPSVPPAATAYANRVRPGADGVGQEPARAPSQSRHIPRAVKRAVWYRDRGQCAFASSSGVRCGEVEFLELHHIQPYTLPGRATVANIALRCRLHNAYEAEVVFGPRQRCRSS